MDYIEQHLSEELPLERLASVASFSKYHFHRLFFARVGETPGQFIHRLRMHKAARLLVTNPDMTVTEIAVASGFGDTAAFSRAFKAAHGMPATAFRECRRNLSISNSNSGTSERNPGTDQSPDGRYDSGIPQSTWRDDMPELKMDPIPAQSVTIVEKPEMTVAYVRHTGPYAGDELLFQRLFTTLHTWAGPRGLVKRGETEEMVIYHDDPDSVPPEKQRLSCCIPVPADTEVGGEIGKLTMPAGTYAECRFEVDATQFGGAWNWVFGVWLPESGYLPDDRLCYEKYTDSEPEAEIDGQTGHRFVVDICVPVVPM
jgi:AraC family transcriptional regulator